MIQPNTQDQPVQESSAFALPNGDINPQQAAELLAQRRSVQSETPPADPAESVEDPLEALAEGPTDTETPQEPEDGPLEEATDEDVDEPESLDESDQDQPDEDTDEAGDTDDTFLLDGEEYTAEQVKEWKESGMRTADYQRKTQVLAQQTQAVEGLEKDLNRFAHAFTQQLQHQMQADVSAVQSFAEVDWATLAREKPNEYTAKKAEFEMAKSRVEDAQQQFNQFRQEFDQLQQANLQQRAKAALPEIKSRVKGWNDAMYAELREFVVGLGAPPDQVNRIVEPWVWELAADAHKYRQAKAVKTKRRPRKRSPSKTLKASAPSGERVKGKESEALQTLQKASGSRGAMEAGAALLSARRAARRG